MRHVVNSQVVLSRPPEGPLAGHIAAFAESVIDQGYSLYTVRRHVMLAACFSRWLKRKGIAASGITPFVQGAFLAAKEKNAKTILVTCSNVFPEKKLTDCVIAVKTGPEVISGSTRLKAGTATKLVLNMLTVTSMIQLGKVYQNWMVDLQPKSKKLKARALRLISHLGSVPPAKAEDYFLKARKNVKAAILMARKGWDYPSAVQKLKQADGFLERAIHD